MGEYEELKKIISAVDEVMENTALLDNIKLMILLQHRKSYKPS